MGCANGKCMQCIQKTIRIYVYNCIYIYTYRCIMMYIYIDVYIDVYIYVYIYIHTYRLDSSFIFIHDIYQVVQDFAQRNGKTRCCKLVRQNAEHIYRLVFPGASYSLPSLEGKHYADVFSPLQHWYLIMIDGYVEFVNLRRTECGDGSGKIFKCAGPVGPSAPVYISKGAGPLGLRARGEDFQETMTSIPCR